MKRSTSTTRRLLACMVAGAGFSVAAPVVLAAPVVYAETSAVTLNPGDRGQSVRALQQALIDAGISVAGGVDGIYGAGTQAAVSEFQKAKGLGVTGSVDAETSAALGLSNSDASSGGTSSDDVKLVQETLIKYGYTVVGGATGTFDANTSRPLKVFQGHNGLKATGEINGATLKLVRSLMGDTGATAEVEAADTSATTTTSPAVAPLAATSGATGAAQFSGVRIGSRGNTVKAVQNALIKLGYDVVGGADGVFGALTANAVKTFQADRGLLVDGYVGPNTAGALAAALSGSGAQGASRPAQTSGLEGLQYGSVGDNVKALQKALMATGLSLRGGADGVFGTATQSTLKNFQRVNGLSQSGKVDAATAKALNASSSNAASGATSANGSTVGLKAGSLGSLVKQLQQALMDAGISLRGGADGIFGPATDQALRSFQRSQGLDATGVVNQATVDALAEPKSGSSASSNGNGYAAYGERGSRVKALQQSLVDAGISVRGGVDGIFGSGTASAVMDFQRRNGLSVTGEVNAATAKALSLAAASKPTTPESSVQVSLQAFPVQGWCGYANTWQASRSGGRRHEGTDIIAAEGKLLYAAASGTIEKVYYDQPGALTGNGIRLRLDDGTYIFYAHMLGVADNIKVGAKVTAGQVVGKVGQTGNAGTPHLHIEIHPGGGAAVNPYPYLQAVNGCTNTSTSPTMR